MPAWDCLPYDRASPSLRSAAQRLAAIDDLPALELIGRTEAVLSRLVDVMNEETTLLRAGRHRDAAQAVASTIFD